ncbi:MAG TPA: glycosyltransferase [Bacteroidales bacterium]|nr:glycosyltransferase [Bacteroidales bacterium]
MTTKLSLIISFYNKVDYLKLIFASLERQTFKDFEVVIADDGSHNEAVLEVEKMLLSASFPVQHIWHEDLGWRKTTILNKAVVAAKSDYLVFIDGDCILHKHFLKEHYNHRGKNVVLVGRRVNLSSDISSILTPLRVRKGYLENISVLLSLAISKLKGRCSHVENGIYLYPKFMRRYFNRKDRGILGANFSVHKDDILKVNGFDERYMNPAVGEDTDIDFRLRLVGVKTQSLKHIAVQYHMYHKTLFRPGENLVIYNHTVKNKISYTPYGIKKES